MTDDTDNFDETLGGKVVTLAAHRFADNDLALTFAEKHRNNLRHVTAWGRWLSWAGTHWQADKTALGFDLVRRFCSSAADTCKDAKTAKGLKSAKTIAAVERLARVDRRLAATTEQWDQDRWLLNMPEGVLDLRTGKVRSHNPNDYMTKVAGVAPGGDCPTWLAFLKRVTGGDADLQAYLQRVAGYALTGETSAHALFFLYGTGANGKSVLADTLAGILGDYHKTAPIETFTASSIDRHPTELAGLRGARLVTAVETEEGRRWAESRIKSLTGGDKISARFMRQDFFEFSPQFKLVIAGNHKPGLRSVDEAIRRRFNLVPFTVTIPPEERDEGLKNKLRDEWPGILAWAVEGCLEWQRAKLSPPEAVTAATDAYMAAEDAIAAWIDERCERNTGAEERSSVLYASWKHWAEKNGEFPGSNKGFTQKLEERGFQSHRKKQGVGFEGLKLLPAEPEGEPWWEK